MEDLFYQILVVMLVFHSVYLNYKIGKINKTNKKNIKFALESITELNKKESDLIKQSCIKGIDARMDKMKGIVERYFKEIKEDLEKNK